MLGIFLAPLPFYSFEVRPLNQIQSSQIQRVLLDSVLWGFYLSFLRLELQVGCHDVSGSWRRLTLVFLLVWQAF